MALYKTHAKLNLFVALPLLIGICAYLLKTNPKYLVAFSTTFIYGTLFMNPDVDLTNKIKLFSIRGLLSLPFRSYSMVFRHRGISHSIFFGTITRLAWLSAILLIILYFWNRTWVENQDFLLFAKKHKEMLLYCFLGFFLADFCHILLDVVSPKKR